MESISLATWKVMASLPYQADLSAYITAGRLIDPATNLVPWTDATVPGSIYRDLLREGLIKDPYYDCDPLGCGGICGFNDKGRFTDCYNIGSSVSGIVGDNRDYIIDCYYLNSVSQNGSGTALNREGERIHVFTMGELTQESTFGTFDFETVWVMTNEGPKLR